MNDTATETPPTENAAPQPANLTPEQISALQAEAAKAKENWIRTAADFENFKKRAAREKIESAQYATAGVLQKILPVLDNFEAAIAAAQNAKDAKSDSFQSGVAMIQQQLKNVLVESGLEEIDALGKPFDPNFHEAISQQESAEVPEGNVLLQLRKGYVFKDRLLRAATVIVAKKPEAKA